MTHLQFLATQTLVVRVIVAFVLVSVVVGLAFAAFEIWRG